MDASLAPPLALERLAPFRRSPESPAPQPATVRGQMPSWLRGQLVRTCPAVFSAGDWSARHWFDGLGMLYSFRVGDDASVDFRSRLLDCELSRDARNGKTRLGSFGTPLVRPLWQRIFQPVPRSTDNTNVNVVRMGDELVAMTESDRQLSIDADTLESRGGVTYDDRALGGAVMSAHPHFDFESGRVLNLATRLGVRSSVSLYQHGAASRQREIVCNWRTDRVPYVHSFGLTPAHAVLIAHPFATRAFDFLWSNHGFIDHFSWRPSEGTRLVVMDRTSGATREHVADPFFVFHTVNAFERQDETVLDVLAYTDADVIAALRIDRMVAHLPDLRPSLMRIVMKRGQERARVEPLGDVGFEFPSIHYRRANGRDYRFVWGASDGHDRSGRYQSAIVKVDVLGGRTSTFSDDGYVFGEPVFVARPDAVDEDDGVLLTVGSRSDAERSALVVIDAKTMTALASAEVPSAIPLGFHGSFVRAASAT
jgi:carotenoid cleavage dioxygenase-like enzyme